MRCSFFGGEVGDNSKAAKAVPKGKTKPTQSQCCCCFIIIAFLFQRSIFTENV